MALKKKKIAKSKQSDVNKSEEIRQCYEANPKIKPKEVVAKLKERGIEVSPQQVSTTRNNAIKQGKLKVRGSKVARKKGAGKPGRPAKVGAKAGRPAKATGGNVSVENLVQAKAMVEKMGGMENAKQAISALDKLLG